MKWSLGVLTAIVIAIVAAVAVASQEGDDDDAGSTVATEMTPEDAAAVACPDPVPHAELTGDGTLPDHPLAVRLCAGPPPGAPMDVPAEALTSDTQEIVDVINGLHEAPANQMCTKELGPSYTLLFTYASGESIPVVGEIFGCRNVYVGSTTRTGDNAAEAVRDLFLERLG